MSNIQVFVYKNLQVRTIEKDGQTWWVLKDVCAVLNITDARRVAKRLDDDELSGVKLHSGGQNREMYVVNESGLYNVILRSDKPEAKPFRKWVTSEVLPEIRKTGAYAPDIQKLIAITVEKTLEQLNKTQMQAEKPIAKKCIGYQQNNAWDKLDEITQQTVLGMMQSGNYSSQKISQYIFDATGIYMSQVTVCKYKRRFFSVI